MFHFIATLSQNPADSPARYLTLHLHFFYCAPHAPYKENKAGGHIATLTVLAVAETHKQTASSWKLAGVTVCSHSTSSIGFLAPFNDVSKRLECLSALLAL